MTNYLYESHMGGFYSVPEVQNDEDLYCETCGDYDYELGEYDTKYDAWCILYPKTSIFGGGGFRLDSVCGFLTDKDENELIGLEDWELLKLIQGALLKEVEELNERDNNPKD